MAVEGPIHERLTRWDMVPFTHTDVLPARNQIFALFTNLGRNNHFALAFSIFTKRNNSFDFTNDSEFLGFPCLKQLGYTWETTSNILGFGRLTRDLSNHITSRHTLSFDNIKIGSHRQDVPCL